jgi:hypothetical protein
LLIELENGQLHVRIFFCITVARKMLQRCNHVSLLQPAHERFDEFRRLLRILTERSGVDDRIVRIRIHIGDG